MKPVEYPVGARSAIDLSPFPNLDKEFQHV
jgi:hypothetical protein